MVIDQLVYLLLMIFIFLSYITCLFIHGDESSIIMKELVHYGRNKERNKLKKGPTKAPTSSCRNGSLSHYNNTLTINCNNKTTITLPTYKVYNFSQGWLHIMMNIQHKEWQHQASQQAKEFALYYLRGEDRRRRIIRKEE